LFRLADRFICVAFAAARSVLDRQCGIVLDTRDSAYSENITAAGPLSCCAYGALRLKSGY